RGQRGRHPGRIAAVQGPHLGLLQPPADAVHPGHGEPEARRHLAEPLTVAPHRALTRLGLVLAAATLAWLPSVGLPAAALAKWGAPFQFAPPGPLDVAAPL